MVLLINTPATQYVTGILQFEVKDVIKQGKDVQKKNKNTNLNKDKKWATTKTSINLFQHASPPFVLYAF